MDLLLGIINVYGMKLVCLCECCFISRSLNYYYYYYYYYCYYYYYYFFFFWFQVFSFKSSLNIRNSHLHFYFLGFLCVSFCCWDAVFGSSTKRQSHWSFVSKILHKDFIASFYLFYFRRICRWFLWFWILEGDEFNKLKWYHEFHKFI